MKYKVLYAALVAAAFGGNFIMFLWVLDNLTVFQGLIYGLFWGFPYAVAIYLTGKLVNGEHTVSQATEKSP